MSQDHSHQEIHQSAGDIAEHGIRTHHEASEGFDNTEPAAGPIWGFTIGSVVILIVVIFALEQYFDKIWNDAVTEKVLEAPSPQLQDVRNRDNWLLTHYQYVDKPKGQVRIPMEQAKQLFLKESAEGKLFYPAKPTLPVKEDQNAPAPGAAAAAPAPAAASKK
jgi:hypothetical protein